MGADSRAGGDAVVDQRKQTRIQSVSRAVRILLAVAESDGGLTVKDVTRQFQLSTPTAYHLLNTLVDERILAKDERRRYILGPGSAAIADAYSRLNVADQLQLNALHSLAQESGETAYLSAWRAGSITVLASVEGSHAVRVAGLIAGYSEDPHARASGKLLLAFAPEEVRDAVLDRTEFRKFTPHTILSKEGLLKEFEEIRRTGLSRDRQEFRLGVECVSAPIIERGEVVACFTLSCPADRYAAEEESILAALRRAARSASRTA